MTLKLKVNERKTRIVHSDEGINFLGVVIGSTYTHIQEKKLKMLKIKVKQITRRNGGMNLAMVLEELNPVLRGFVNYFKVANISQILKPLTGWIRRRLSAIQLKLWKKVLKLHRILKLRGF
ncbi:group II intron maturase-specific domain-containing protein [Shewanella psychropiezotolerans]|uniref:group II intron maturase-specific domain-containing protein n=1 Tax=Shewanella psychropiezotolerans TaxID=2593655 RepID=UPI001E2B056E|nr:group II intron maturase-specific domain-containing protein [Shewanella psychropiezotolerans]